MKDFWNNFLKSQQLKWGLDLPYFTKNGFWIAFQQIIGSMSGLLLIAVFARMVDKNTFGQYQLAISIIYFISIIALPGLNIAVARSVARGNDGDYPQAVKKSFKWALCGVPILVIIGLYYYLFQQNQVLGIALMASSLIFPFIFAPNTWNGFFLGKQNFRSNALLTSFQSLTVSLAIISVIFLFKNNLIALVLTYCILSATLNLFYYFRSLRYISNRKIDQETVSYGYFLTLTNSLEVLSEYSDKIIVGMLLSPAHLAIFSITSFLPLKFGNFIKPFFSILFPKLTSDKITIKDIFKNNKKILRWLFLLIISGSILYYFLIEKINLLFFGNNYINEYSYSRYFVILILFSFPLHFLIKYIQAKKMKVAIFANGPIFIIIKSALMILGIYLQGLSGAIIAFNFAILIKFILSVSLIKK